MLLLFAKFPKSLYHIYWTTSQCLMRIVTFGVTWIDTEPNVLFEISLITMKWCHWLSVSNYAGSTVKWLRCYYTEWNIQYKFRESDLHFSVVWLTNDVYVWILTGYQQCYYWDGETQLTYRIMVIHQHPNILECLESVFSFINTRFVPVPWCGDSSCPAVVNHTPVNNGPIYACWTLSNTHTC